MGWGGGNYCYIAPATQTLVTAQSFKSPRAFYSLTIKNYNYKPLNQPRRSSLMSHDQRARDCRLRVFLHIITRGGTRGTRPPEFGEIKIRSKLHVHIEIQNCFSFWGTSGRQKSPSGVQGLRPLDPTGGVGTCLPDPCT